MEKEVVRNYNSKNRNLLDNKWFITALIICSILLLLIIFISVRLYLEIQLVQLLSEQTIKQALLKQIKIRKDDYTQNSTPENLTQAKQNIVITKDYIQNQINDLKTKGQTEFIKQNKTLICADGEIISPKERFNGKKCNYSVSGKTTSIGESYINISKNDSEAIRLISIKSFIVTIQEYIYKGLEENEKGINNIEQASAIILDQLLYLFKKTSHYQAFTRVLQDRYKNKTIDATKEIEKFEDFNKNFKVKSEQEIQEIEFKKYCLEAFKKIRNQEARSSFGSVKNVLNFPIYAKLFLLEPSFKKTCENLEKYQKQHIIEMLRKTKQEKNPFIAIENKFYINLFVECKDEWFPLYHYKELGEDGEYTEQTCIDDYKDNFSQKLKQHLDS